MKTDETSAVNVHLKPPGSIVIEGSPKGATVHMTGPNGFDETVGIPSTISKLPRGTYRLTASRSGSDPERHRIDVRSGRTCQFAR